MKEQYTEIYRKNADRMARAKAMCEAAAKRGDRELARKYRNEYSELKAEIDTIVYQMIIKEA